ncbi:MAG: DNA (cytosine-5-)-methyltransferase [Treponema sp.]|nr:DNA (cytosine-5-)-methyltransferase [Treponema sp.]
MREGNKFTFVDLFAGIGGFHQAAGALGGKCVFASEIDSEAKRAYKANYNITPHGDITKIEASKIPDHDVLLAGFPCQPFSIIGKKLGFDDIRGTLFFEIARILKEKKPRIFILENVKQLKTHDNGKTLEIIINILKELDYNIYYDILNALNYGLPQKRERIIIAGFLNKKIEFIFPKSKSTGNLKDILMDDNEIEDKYFASNEIVKKRKQKHKSEYYPGIWHENKGGNISSYPYSCALRAGASYNYLLVNGVRRLTPREMLRLQGFPDSFKIICSDSQTRKQAGNAVPVNMIKAVLNEALEAETKVKSQKNQGFKNNHHNTANSL